MSMLRHVHGYRYLVDNIDWLEDHLGDFDEDYLLLDCPGNQSLHLLLTWIQSRSLTCICTCKHAGQIELYAHLPVMRQITEFLVKKYVAVFVMVASSWALNEFTLAADITSVLST
jgi:hypothetical protein